MLLPALGVSGLAPPSPQANDWLRLGGLIALLSGAGAMACGLGILVFMPVVAGRAREAAGSHRVILGATLFAVATALVLSNLLPLLSLSLTRQREIRSVAGFLPAALAVSGTLLTVAWLRFIRPGVVTLRDLGLSSEQLARPRELVRDLALGVLVWVSLGVTSNAIQELLKRLGVTQTQLQDYTWVLKLAPAELALVVLAGAVFAPIAEEIFFRGIIFGQYYRSKGPLTAYAISSIVFATLHFNVQAFLPLVAMGIILAFVYRVTGTLAPGIVAHGLNNGIAFLALYSGWVRPGG
jgi:membrane protease YdiL (CAAX protease family)